MLISGVPDIRRTALKKLIVGRGRRRGGRGTSTKRTRCRDTEKQGETSLPREPVRHHRHGTDRHSGGGDGHSQTGFISRRTSYHFYTTQTAGTILQGILQNLNSK